MATLRGEPVDRPAVNFYEITGQEDRGGEDPFNIYSDPSWQGLLDLARDHTDRIVMCSVGPQSDLPAKLVRQTTWLDDAGSRFTRTEISAGERTLTALRRRDRDMNTDWMIEHPVKNADDLRAWLALPTGAGAVVAPWQPHVTERTDLRDPTWLQTAQPRHPTNIDTRGVLAAERALGDTGIAMLDTPDPLCRVAELMDMEGYLVLALTEPDLMHAALERVAATLLPHIAAVAAALPGRLWRIYGPEYACPPYLPPRLFAQYVVRYVTPMVEAIHRHGGYARIHCHGRLAGVLDHIAATGCDALDPIEPPPLGDLTLAQVRRRVGEQMVLFGNLQIRDIETLPTPRFAEKVSAALHEGTAGRGRGFVLMPSACPCGRKLSTLAMENYRKMVELVEA